MTRNLVEYTKGRDTQFVGYIILAMFLVLTLFFILSCTTQGGSTQPDPFPLTSRDISVYCEVCNRNVGASVLPDYNRGTVTVLFDCGHLNPILFRWSERDREWYRGHR